VRLAKAVVSRIKILARLNIAERRLPQDGRIRHVIGSQALDLRVATLPTVHGESVVIRLLPVNTGIRDLAGIGLPPPLQRVLHHLAEAPHGLILVTGPTGSGKSTTLYATLQLINKPERKVLTVEDPVEYQMEGVNQVQVKPQIDLTFARILRSMLRQDPDVIMIGEMRDSETATIAIHAALTGHLVLSTLHTNDAPSAVTRLIDMNIEPFLLASTVRTVIAQRLVRVLCPECKEPLAPGDDFLAVLAAADLDLSPPKTIYAARGCEACNATGFSGRVGIFEMMMMSDAVRRLTIARASANDIGRAAKADGMITMLEDGLSKVAAGITTFEEVRRVTES
jgi:general secretion pathway protein E